MNPPSITEKAPIVTLSHDITRRLTKSPGPRKEDHGINTGRAAMNRTDDDSGLVSYNKATSSAGGETLRSYNRMTNSSYNNPYHFNNA